ncbi:Para-nitrobenzyl esterase [Colletotrichum orbiculare MAFF 240422]|uniref:Carboxylic ester hydrolase n=1 Tax=Colletotrichum orbiculare (strain 104-T / ATCC 96160 / CBS 514.97 / LARS 414 / MAFF 240422) TaxID=1213857 RepID=A0A484FMD4_COLOR|nr:Para-nitrobenzyl esterase [Colletotrichum orbiculare MAFF 240422]
MWAGAALVALLAAFVSCVPSPQSLKTDITILRENDLRDAKSSTANTSALFLGEMLSLREANATCLELGEQLWTPESNSTQRLLAMLDYREHNVSAMWVSADGSNPRAISATGHMSCSSSSDTLPALCTHTAPFSNGVAQDTNHQWQVMLYKGSGDRVSALEFGAACFQGFGGSEDCHFLNIYTPYIPRSRRTDERLRPVMLWIHGGAFTGGFGSDPLFDGGNLASRGDVVVVTINYRLGTLGFLALDDDVTNGNFGIADQIVALDWVLDHIRDFGGDPARITIFGQSAGGAAIRALMASPKARGKFAGAIPMSSLGGLSYGASYAKYFSIEEQMDIAGNTVLRTTNCTDAKSKVDCLQRVPAEKLDFGARFLVVDGKYITSDELQLNGDPLDVHLMMGITAEDGLPFLVFPQNGTVPDTTSWLGSQGLPDPP